MVGQYGLRRGRDDHPLAAVTLPKHTYIARKGDRYLRHLQTTSDASADNVRFYHYRGDGHEWLVSTREITKGKPLVLYVEEAPRSDVSAQVPTNILAPTLNHVVDVVAQASSSASSVFSSFSSPPPQYESMIVTNVAPPKAEKKDDNAEANTVIGAVDMADTNLLSSDEKKQNPADNKSLLCVRNVPDPSEVAVPLSATPLAVSATVSNSATVEVPLAPSMTNDEPATPLSAFVSSFLTFPVTSCDESPTEAMRGETLYRSMAV